jgi:predicted GIY-YIG superfamily endonuclease
MSTNGFPAPNARGVVYLVHFSGRTKQNRQHYLGFSSDLERRYRQHRLGWGATETKKAITEGLKLTVAQTWDGTPTLERRLKEWSKAGKKGFSGICPM